MRKFRGEWSIKTIALVDQCSMTIENHLTQWLNDPKTIKKSLKAMVWKSVNGNGWATWKPLMLMVLAKKDITIPSLLKNDHCSPLFWDWRPLLFVSQQEPISRFDVSGSTIKRKALDCEVWNQLILIEIDWTHTYPPIHSDHCAIYLFNYKTYTIRHR